MLNLWGVYKSYMFIHVETRQRFATAIHICIKFSTQKNKLKSSNSLDIHWVWPPPSNSSTKMIPFLVGNPYKPSFVTGILRGGHTQDVPLLFVLWSPFCPQTSEQKGGFASCVFELHWGPPNGHRMTQNGFELSQRYFIWIDHPARNHEVYEQIIHPFKWTNQW